MPMVASPGQRLENTNRSDREERQGVLRRRDHRWNEVGIKALDDYTLQYTLNRPIPHFLTMLTYVSFLLQPVPGRSEQVWRDRQNILYNGAYIISEWEPQNFRTMVKNEVLGCGQHPHQADELPVQQGSLYPRSRPVPTG